MKKCALHGFLGRPSDWDFLPDWEALDLFVHQVPLKEWGRWFNQTHQTDILMGYSMGGRLALHALLDDPSRYKGAIIVSADPRSRLSQSGEKFASEPWDSLMEEWNQQPVFQHDPVIIRKEEEFDRRALVYAFEEWSKQENMVEAIASLEIPILWVVGELDTKYVEIAKQLSISHPLSKIWIAKGCGHRVPWKVQQKFVEEIRCFYQSIGHPSKLTQTSN